MVFVIVHRYCLTWMNKLNAPLMKSSFFIVKNNKVETEYKIDII